MAKPASVYPVRRRLRGTSRPAGARASGAIAIRGRAIAPTTGGAPPAFVYRAYTGRSVARAITWKTALKPTTAGAAPESGPRASVSSAWTAKT